MKTKKWVFFLFLACTLLLMYVAVFGVHNVYLGWNINGAVDMRWGIDIRGGVEAMFSPKDLDHKPTSAELESARTVIENRLDAENILDREVAIDYVTGEVIVRFPWKTGETEFDPGEAIAELGEMAQLTFVDPDGNVIMTGAAVKPNTATWARGDINPSTGAPTFQVHLSLTPEGAVIFEEATGRLVGQIIKTYLDDVEKSSAEVQTKISGGEVAITGLGSEQEARELAQTINAGALPFALETNHYSTTSPILGSNALEVMTAAMIAAFIIICIYMILFYRVSGIVACVALMLQLAGILLMLSIPQITVTLPGLAAVILSLGMGVDANIIIAERIREELRGGRALDAAINFGFKRGFSSVFDGNITALIVSIIMLIFGSGAILSFAYSLMFGIFMNFFAGIFANRMMTQSITRIKALRKNSCFMSKKALARAVPIFNFYAKRKLYVIISSAVILFGVVMLIINGVNLDIAFKGGAVYRYGVDNITAADADEAAAIAAGKLNRTVTGQVTINARDGSKTLVLNIPLGENISNEDIAGMETALKEAFPDNTFTYEKSQNVSSYYGQKFLRNGMIAIILSSILIILYVWFSFRKIHGLSAGVMALLALLHDIVVVFFAFVIFQIPLGDTFIAVVLTILGYSINDTIVIYDRVRENALADPSMPPDKLMNTSMSQVLVRAVNTSVAIFFSVLVVFILAAVNGLESIMQFALPMGLGTLSGCYSTFCVACPLWVTWQKQKKDSVLKKRRV